MTDISDTTFLYTIDANKIGNHFKEHSTSGKYNSYVSKYFYGAVIRSRRPLYSLDGKQVVMNVRPKGRGGNGQTVTGIKIDLIELGDERIEKYGIEIKDLPAVEMQITSNIKQNIILNPTPALLNAFFYKDKDGSSIINIVEK